MIFDIKNLIQFKNSKTNSKHLQNVRNATLMALKQLSQYSYAVGPSLLTRLRVPERNRTLRINERNLRRLRCFVSTNYTQQNSKHEKIKINICVCCFLFPEKLFAMRALAAKNRAKQTTLNMNLICIYGKQRDGGVLLQF